VSADVVIIGGGIVGVCCAYYLAQAGVKVHLVEHGCLASGASGACEGNILQWDKPAGIMLQLGMASAALYEALAHELPFDIEYVKKGSILVAERAAELDGAKRLVQTMQSAGIPCKFLTVRELRELEPNLAPDVAGGAVFPDDAQVQPMLAVFAFARAATQTSTPPSGAFAPTVLQPFTTATGIEVSNGEVVAVKTSNGRIPTRIVVDAAGVWSKQVGEWIGVDVPVLPRKGHIVVTEPVANIVQRKMMEAGYTGTVESDTRGLAIAAVVESTASGNILLGSSREVVGIDRTVNPDVIRAIVARAIRFFPCLAGIHAMRTYAGLRPFTPDHVPIIGESQRVRGFYIATGHEGTGICFGPITGKLISQLVTGQPTDLPVNELSPARFDHSA
jgi:glycine/D-amino acid oxidase-like deaminating enzyme